MNFNRHSQTSKENSFGVRLNLCSLEVTAICKCTTSGGRYVSVKLVGAQMFTFVLY